MDTRQPQHLLNELLQAELYHTMGAYGVAVDRLAALHREGGDPSSATAEALATIVDARDLGDTLATNKDLRDVAHHGNPPGSGGETRRRHPKPARDYGQDGARVPLALATCIDDYYRMTVEAIKSAEELPHPKDGDRPPPDDDLSNDQALSYLGARLGVTQDPQRRGNLNLPQDEIDLEVLHRARMGKLARALRRRREAQILLDGHDRREPLRHEAVEAAETAKRILKDDLDPKRERELAPLHRSVIAALVDAHLRMHQVEHEQSGSFFETFVHGRYATPAIEHHLKRSIVLNTFAYTVARSAPWIFAEDCNERRFVLTDYVGCSHNRTPTLCMWLAQQVSLLALHRRGYTHWLAGHRALAYRDFYKLKRLIRIANHSLERQVALPPEAPDFLDGLYALAEHHTAEIYQAEHAHGVALRHFDRASKRLRRLDDSAAASQPWAGQSRQRSMPMVLRNSRWRVRLLISQGKTYSELGRTKRSLLCYVRAWRAFLELADTEVQVEPNLRVVDQVIDWLTFVADEPDVNKVEVQRRFEPLVDQFATIAKTVHLRWLAADIMMRIGHGLFILKLPGPGKEPRDDRLAHLALSQALQLDEQRTLIGADIKKIEKRNPDFYDQTDVRKPPSLVTIDRQWPSGDSEFEGAARVIEYLLQEWMEAAPDGDPAQSIERALAGGLLPAFLTHTDSSNVKLAQVYRYLMQEATPTPPPPTAERWPMIEFACCRRYSSFFPFLPRPSPFRVRGGGYFVRIYDEQLAERADEHKLADHASRHAFGIVVDPGPDFLENLYRCGYCLSDIDMIMVTHDHADHLASLDALLSLLGYRKLLGDRRFRGRPVKPRKPGKKAPLLLPIVGNESVVQRYRFYNEELPPGTVDEGESTVRPDAVRVLSFEELETVIESQRLGQPDDEPILLPPSLRVRSVPAVAHTDSHGNLASGFVLELECGNSSRPSIGFTSDTGLAVPAEDGPDGDPEWMRDTNVTVAHVSSVPLPELRLLAGLDRAPEEAREQTESFQRLWARAGEEPEGGAKASAEFLLRQLQFGFRSRARKGDPELGVSPLSPLEDLRDTVPREGEEPKLRKHLYMSGVLEIAKRMAARGKGGLLLIGEFREELGTFRTRVAAELQEAVFKPLSGDGPGCSALTADIGLKLSIDRDERVEVLCSTCDLDTDLTEEERYHSPDEIFQVCVKGEDEGVFYNCPHHDPQSQPEPLFVELVERFEVFGK
jgi:tetratricopeptide (TPR) repeat protein